MFLMPIREVGTMNSDFCCGKLNKKFVLLRQGYTCALCRRVFTNDNVAHLHCVKYHDRNLTQHDSHEHARAICATPCHGKTLCHGGEK